MSERVDVIRDWGDIERLLAEVKRLRAVEQAARELDEAESEQHRLAYVDEPTCADLSDQMALIDEKHSADVRAANARTTLRAALANP